jgi:glycosyltransferase involved in cell wall biosynthesis
MEQEYYTNIFYFDRINKIGGVETFFYEIAKKYCDKDITIFYSFGDLKQIQRLKKLVRVIKYTGQKIKCKKAFFNYNLKPIDNIQAEKYYEIIHANYKDLGVYPNIHAKIDEYIGVSQSVCDAFTELTHLPCTLCYNPITIEKPKKVLYLISATRLTREKGKDRILKLAKALDDAGIPYI